MKQMKQIEIDFERCKKTTLSCRKNIQMVSAIKMNTHFSKKWQQDKDLLFYLDKLSKLQTKRIQVLKDYPLEGNRCIVVSNSKEGNVEIGTVTSFIDWDKEDQSFLPLVKFDKDNIEYLCMGILLHYDKETEEKLNALPNRKEKWNTVCKIKSK